MSLLQCGRKCAKSLVSVEFVTRMGDFVRIRRILRILQLVRELCGGNLRFFLCIIGWVYEMCKTFFFTFFELFLSVRLMSKNVIKVENL